MLFDRVYAPIATPAAAVAQLVARISGASQTDLAQRRGELPPAGSPLFWFHGASAGEMAAATNLVELLRGAGFSFAAGFTTTNQGGIDWLRNRAPADAAVSLLPWDAPRPVARAFERWQPRAVFLVETEIWPSLILAAARRGVPLFSVSSRIYPRDVNRYRLARPFLAPTFGRLTAVLAQSEIERQRFIDLGAAAERCYVAGNLKHLSFDSSDPRPAGQTEPGLVVCGSIHRDEIAGLFSALESAARPENRFVVAPRHAEGVALAEQEAARRGWTVGKRSELRGEADRRVVLLDTMGELASFYARAEAAVVGGGFERHGGHNPYEPVRVGTPVFFGIHFDHFQSEARRLAGRAPESQVSGWRELGERLRAHLGDANRLQNLLERQSLALPDGAAIGRRYLDILAEPLARIL